MAMPVKLTGLLSARCVEHASIETSDSPTGNNATTSRLLNISWLTKRGSRILEVKALIHPQCGSPHDVGAVVRDNEVLGAEAVDSVEVVGRIPHFLAQNSVRSSSPFVAIVSIDSLAVFCSVAK